MVRIEKFNISIPTIVLYTVRAVLDANGLESVMEDAIVTVLDYDAIIHLELVRLIERHAGQL